MLIRAIHSYPACRRAYSSFFSSKPGGGRYFNSAKPPKSVVAGSGSKGKPEPPAPADIADGTQSSGSTGASASGSGKQVVKAGAEEPTQSSSLTNSKNSVHDTPSSSQSIFSTSPTPIYSAIFPKHPTLNSNDYKLHQFFSLHRPLLLLPQHVDAIFEAPPSLPSTNPLSSSPVPGKPSDIDRAPPPPACLGTLDDPPEATAEADADAARLIVRALVMNRAGGTIQWEDTLRRLGLDVDLDAGRMGLKEEWAREWEEVMLDSTKRKRKRKMRKHKLRKRRKATRAHRLKIGR